MRKQLGRWLRVGLGALAFLEAAHAAAACHSGLGVHAPHRQLSDLVLRILINKTPHSLGSL